MSIDYLDERIDLICKNMRQGHFFLILLWVMFSAGTHQYVSLQEYLTWSAILISYVFLSWFFILNSKYVLQNSASYRLKAYTVHNALLAICWGFASWIGRMAPEPFLIMLLIVGPILGGIVAVGVIPRVFYAWCIPQLLILTFALLSYSGLETWIAIALLVALLPSIIFFERNVSKMFIDLLVIRRNNEKLLAQLREKSAEDEKRNEEKSRFIATACHDLRQPLHAISLFLEGIDPKNPEISLHTVLERLKKATNNVNQLVSDLLDLSRLESGNTQPVIKTFAIAKLFAELEQEFFWLAQKKGLTLKVRTATYYIESDYILLQRILRNLLSNAIHYTRAGTVLMGCRLNGNNISIHVIDSGTGIAQTDLPRVFEEFQRLDQKEEKQQQGLGLGLSIVNRLAKILDTSVKVQSQLGCGSNFSISIPKGIKPSQTSSFSTSLIVELQSCKILVLEDDTETRNAVKQLLLRWKCNPYVYQTAESALFDLKKHPSPPEIILADYHLGEGLNGLQAIERIREVYDKKIPAALVSADASIVSPLIHSESGIAVMTKPVQAAKLQNMLRRMIHP